VLNFNIRILVLLIVLLPTLLAGLAVSASLMQARLSDMEAELEARARHEAAYLANAGQLPMLVGDYDTLTRLANSHLEGDEAAGAALFLNPDGAIVVAAGAGSERLLAERCMTADALCADSDERYIFRKELSSGEGDDDADRLFAAGAAQSAKTVIGEVVLSFVPDALLETQRQFLQRAWTLTAVVVFGAALVAIWFSRRLSVPIQQLSDVVSSIREGDLQARADVKAVGELRNLQIGINEMADRVAASKAELNRRVDEATADLSNALLVLERRNADLDAALKRADEAGRAKDMFLARMSHEMRTPLTSVVSCARLIESSENEQQREEHVALIRVACDVLRGIIDDVLDYQKIASGQLRIERVPFDLHAMTDRVVRMMRAEPRSEPLDIVCEIAPAVPVSVKGDELRLQQVLFNLLGNAVKFTHQGSVTLSLTAVDASLVQIDVVDTGIGISAQQQERLFQPFSQADESTSRRFGGSGLGLSIAKALTEAMGGTLALSSETGRGTRVSVRLPLQAIAVEEHQRTANQSSDVMAGTVRVLVVEDNDLNRRLILSELTELGAVVDGADSGPEALSTLAAGHYDLVITDVQMPVMDGVALSMRIRDRWAGTPVYALTANVVDNEKRALIDAGVRGILHKPFDRDEVAELLSMWSRPDSAEALLRPNTAVRAGEVAIELRKLCGQVEELIETKASPDALRDKAHELLGVARMFCRGPLVSSCERLQRSVHAEDYWAIAFVLRRIGDLIDMLGSIRSASQSTATGG